MKKILLSLFICTALVSCKNDTSLTFSIANETSIKIDSLYIEPNSNRNEEKIISIPASASKTYITNFKGIEKTDGTYKMYFKRGGQSFHETFGYYSNGAPMEKQIVIKIEEDTVLYNYVVD